MKPHLTLCEYEIFAKGAKVVRSLEDVRTILNKNTTTKKETYIPVTTFLNRF